MVKVWHFCGDCGSGFFVEDTDSHCPHYEIERA